MTVSYTEITWDEFQGSYPGALVVGHQEAFHRFLSTIPADQAKAIELDGGRMTDARQLQLTFWQELRWPDGVGRGSWDAFSDWMGGFGWLASPHYIFGISNSMSILPNDETEFALFMVVIYSIAKRGARLHWDDPPRPITFLFQIEEDKLPEMIARINAAREREPTIPELTIRSVS